MNRKAQLTDGSQFNIFTVMIVGLLFVLFCSGIIYVSGVLNTVFTQVGVTNDQTPHQNVTFPCINNASETCGGTFNANLTLAAQEIWGTHYQSIQALRMVSVIYLLAMFAAVILVAALERKHPLLFFIYILYVLLGVIFAPAISNGYETLINSGVFGGELTNFTTSTFILLNLPIFILIVGGVSAVFLFINLIRPSPEGGNLE